VPSRAARDHTAARDVAKLRRRRCRRGRARLLRGSGRRWRGVVCIRILLPRSEWHRRVTDTLFLYSLYHTWEAWRRLRLLNEQRGVLSTISCSYPPAVRQSRAAAEARDELACCGSGDEWWAWARGPLLGGLYGPTFPAQWPANRCATAAAGPRARGALRCAPDGRAVRWDSMHTHLPRCPTADRQTS
jgi:hypothetical protein